MGIILEFTHAAPEFHRTSSNFMRLYDICALTVDGKTLKGMFEAIYCVYIGHYASIPSKIPPGTRPVFLTSAAPPCM
jgi:hypothetical protein